MAQFSRSCARPTGFAAIAVWTALCGCGEAPAPPARPPAAGPAQAAAPPEEDQALAKAKHDAEQAQRDGDLLRQALAFRIYATVLRDRRRFDEASQLLLAAVAAASAEWTDGDGTRRAEAGEEIDGGCTDLEELVNRGIIGGAVTHNQAVAWYGQLHHQVQRTGRRAHAAALRHQQSHHAVTAERLDDAAEWAAEAVSEREALGLTVPAAWSLNRLGYVQLLQGKHDAAWRTLGRAVHTVCGRGLNEVARTTIQNLGAVIRSHIDADRPAKAAALLRELWAVAGGDPAAEPPRPGWTGGEQSFVLEVSKELHLLAGDLDAAEQALIAILWISHRGEVFRPDVDAALWLELATFAHEQRGDHERALRYLATSMELHQLLDHALGIGWVHARRGAVLLSQAEAEGVPEARKRQLVEEAVAESRAALQRFEACGNHRNGRLMAVQRLKHADELRGNPDGAAAWAKQAAELWQQPPPEPATPHHFPPVDADWTQMVGKLATTAPIVEVVREADGWLVTDLVDGTGERVPFDWADRRVHVRLLRFNVGGGTIRTPVKFGGYAVYVPKFHGVQILRNGLILPAGPKIKGAVDLEVMKHRYPPPALAGAAPAKNGDKK